MDHSDVLIIGGGPAGSTCAGKLCSGGLDVLVLDKAHFPRPKLCAGWITPAVVQELHIDLDEYRQGRVLQMIAGFRVGRIGGPNLVVRRERPMSFGIRRSEFDDYLLRRCGARLQLGEAVDAIRRDGDDWIVNERHHARMLVAAGGHFCPVARMIDAGTLGVQPSRQHECSGRDACSAGGPLIASQEVEFLLTPAQQADCPVDPEIPEIYFCNDLLGYGWCMRKGNYLNVGLGRADRRRLPEHVADFCRWLQDEGRIPREMPKFHGHAYLLYEHSTRRLLDDGVLWIGDAAGLAYPQSGEGIRPAVESGLMAAGTILAAQGDYRAERLDAYRGQIESRFGPRATRSAKDRKPSLIRRLAALATSPPVVRGA